MARKKPARPAKKAKKQAKKKTASKPAARRGAKKSASKAARKKSAPKRSAKPAKARKPAAKARPAKKTAKPAGRLISAVKKLAGAAIVAGVDAALAPRKKPNLDRPRKTVADVHGIPSSLDMNRTASAAKSGRAEMKDRLSKTTGAGPALTSGDVDADWESAEAVGDEAPGGDNPTPDQDVVDDIGKALGVEYQDNEELKGVDKVIERDRKRWELDPASAEDYKDHK